MLRRELPYVANRVFAGFRSHVLIGYAAAFRAPVFRVLKIVECDLPFMARRTFHGHLSMGTAGTVSYTHLDVYKRQDQHNQDGSAARPGRAS